MATYVDLPIPDTPQEKFLDVEEFAKFEKVYDAFRILREKLPEYFITVGDLPAGNGILVRTGTNTWELRTLQGTANEIDVADGDGVAANPILSLPNALTFTGKTITGGTFNGDEFNGPIGVTTPSTITVEDGLETAASIKFPSGHGFFYEPLGTQIGITDGVNRRIMFAPQAGGNTGMEIGRVDGVASLCFIDFHTGATFVDQDARILVQNGTGVVGGARMDLFCSQLAINPAGTASAPAITRTTDADTGIYWSAANVLSVTAGTTQVVDFSATGADFREGISFGALVGASPQDLSEHIALFGTIYGFSVTANRLNLVVPTSADWNFVTTAGTDIVRIDGGSHTLIVGPDVTTETTVLSAGGGRTGDGSAELRLVSNAGFAAGGFQIVRDAGTNVETKINHRGTGVLRIRALEAGSIQLETSNTTRLTVSSAGLVTIGANTEFDQVAANNENATVSQFITTNGSDGRFRKASAAHAMQEAGAYHRIATQAIATGTNTTTINLPTTRNWAYVDVVIRGLTAGADFAPYLRINGDSTGGNYRYAGVAQLTTTGAQTNIFGGATPGCINLFSTGALAESTNGVYNCTLRIYNPRGSTRKTGHFEISSAIAASDGNYYGYRATCVWLSTAAITSFTLHIQNTAAQTIGGSGVNATAGTLEIWGAF